MELSLEKVAVLFMYRCVHLKFSAEAAYGDPEEEYH